MRKVPFVLAALLALTGTVEAEVTPEVRPFVGAYIPTGEQSDVLQNSMFVGGQVAVEIAKTMHLVGTLAYATPRPERRTIGNDVHIYQYDVGAELFRLVPMANRWTFRPFVGGGVGARTHDFHDVDNLDAETYLAGYGALGAEFQLARIGVRLEARHYITRFKGLLGNEEASARNDLMLGAGMAIHLR